MTSDNLYSRLPSELIAEIFVNCLPPSEFVAPNPHHAPMLLSQVSAIWRGSCLSTPKLWSSLSMDIGRIVQNNVGVAEVACIMSTWLSRAKGCPLSISMASDTFIPQDIWDIFFDFSSQWCRIRINSRAPAVFPNKLKVPLLETFELQFRDSSVEHARHVPSMLQWSSISGLRRFGWDNSGHGYHRLGFNWSRLTHLTLNAGMSVEDCLDILEESKVLTHVAFQNVIVPSLPSSRDSIYLPRLQSLGFRADKSIASLLDTLVVPNVREFVFNAMITQDGLWPQKSFLDLIDRSACALQSISFYYFPFALEELLECLGRTQSSLKALTLQTRGEPLVTDDLLDALTVKDDLCLCPKLQVLALYECISCSPGRVAEMVKSRLDTTQMPSTNIRAVSRIEVIEMYDSERELGPLKELRNQGVILKVYSMEGHSLGLSPEEDQRLQKLEEDGLNLQIYDLATGHFWEVES